MLVMPKSKAAFRIAGFDPGSTNLGFSLVENTLDNKPSVVKDSFTVKLKDNKLGYSNIGEQHGSRVVRLMIMHDEVINLLRIHQPHAVVIESNYLGKFATSFAALVECVITIRQAVYAYDPFMQLYLVDPTTVKINTGMKKVRGTDKEDVRRHLRECEDLEWEVDIDTLDEHSVDASAIAYYYAKKLL